MIEVFASEREGRGGERGLQVREDDIHLLAVVVV